jgi:hypothetical protein
VGPVGGAAAQVMITFAPPAVSNDTEPVFEFTDPATPAAERFECRLDGLQDTACISPKDDFGPLPDGTYTFEVTAIYPGGVPVPTSDSHQFTVDTTAPGTSIDSGPSGPTADNTPEFTFSSPDTPDATFQCRLRQTMADFGPCQPLGPLPDGAYVFEVRAVDAAGNTDASPASTSFQIDTTPPDTAITGGPGDTTAATAVFLFSAPGGVRFSCRLDGGAWQDCGSPVTYQSLGLGPHRFEVTAVDAAGNEDPTPAGHSWQVLRPGLVIPGAVAQATALARELVQMRRALARVRLRTLARRRTLLFRTFDALTAGTVKVRARTRVRQGGRRRWVKLLAGEREVPGAGRHRVRASVTRKGRRLARTRKRLPLELRLGFTDLAGRSLWARSELILRR